MVLISQDPSNGLPSSQIRKRVQKARDIQTKRFKHEKIISNSEMTTKLIKKYCVLNKESLEFMKIAVNKLNLSARSYNKILKVAKTIGDLENSFKIETVHLAEALQYRPKTDSFI